MSGFGTGKKRRQETQISNRLKPAKGIPKFAVEDIYPFPISNSQTISSQLKQYVNQLQRQYIERYNILINNRLIYEDLIENISTQLDEKGINIEKLSQIYKNYVFLDNKNKTQQHLQ